MSDRRASFPAPSPLSILLALALLALGACGDDDGPGPTGDAGPGVDASAPFDGGGGEADAATEPDAGAPADAAPDGGTDAGMDAGPPCACPTLPTTCTGPVAGPVFSPEDPAFGEQLMEVLACADESLHMALYLPGWDCIGDALADKLEADEDIVMEIVVDDDQCPTFGGTRDCDMLRGIADHPRVTIVDDDRSALMHHKYIVADGTSVWVSSANMTEDSFCEDLNNSVVIDDATIVGRFEEVFQRMFTDGSFGPVEPEGVTESAPYRLYFSPESPISSPSGWFTALTDAIAEAETSVDVMIFALTRGEISEALVAAHERGVEVRVLSSFRFGGEAAIQTLQDAGIDARVADVHHKVMILDGETVATGSANWSMNAWSNSENSLWIADADVASAFTDELDRVWATASPAE
ncbi:MAG: hypothetical protein CMH59_07160 [Myxococcales bacterium]|nr:hypothetical protein [Myxococcales bacterium]